MQVLESQTVTLIYRNIFPEKKSFSGELLEIRSVSALSNFFHFQPYVIHTTLIFECLLQERSWFKEFC